MPALGKFDAITACDPFVSRPLTRSPRLTDTPGSHDAAYRSPRMVIGSSVADFR
jgi:hypothetical protein